MIENVPRPERLRFECPTVPQSLSSILTHLIFGTMGLKGIPGRSGRRCFYPEPQAVGLGFRITAPLVPTPGVKPRKEPLRCRLPSLLRKMTKPHTAERGLISYPHPFHSHPRAAGESTCWGRKV